MPLTQFLNNDIGIWMRANKIPSLIQSIGHVLQEVPDFLLRLEHVVHGELGTDHVEEHVIFYMAEKLPRGAGSILLDKGRAKVPEAPHFTALSVLNSLVRDIHAVVVPRLSDVPLPQVTTLTTRDVEDAESQSFAPVLLIGVLDLGSVLVDEDGFDPIVEDSMVVGLRGLSFLDLFGLFAVVVVDWFLIFDTVDAADLWFDFSRHFFVWV